MKTRKQGPSPLAISRTVMGQGEVIKFAYPRIIGVQTESMQNEVLDEGGKPALGYRHLQGSGISPDRNRGNTARCVLGRVSAADPALKFSGYE